MKTRNVFRSKKQQLVCLLLVSSLLSSCIGDNATGISKVYSSADFATHGEGNHHIEEKPNDDKIKDRFKYRKELVAKMIADTTMSIDQKLEISKVLMKLPIPLLELHGSKDGIIEFVTGDWGSYLSKNGIKINEQFIDYTDSIYKPSNKTMLDSLAHAFKSADGKIKLLVRADNNVNYANNGENRKRLYYAAMKSLMSLHNSEIDADQFIKLIQNSQNTDGRRYLSHPSIIKLLHFAEQGITLANKDYQNAINESLAYLWANHAEDPQLMEYFLPELAHFFDQLDLHYWGENNLGLENNFVNKQGKSTNLNNWFVKIPDEDIGCHGARGLCDKLSFKFDAPIWSVIGYEIEFRDAIIDKLIDREGKDIISMDLVLAKSSPGTGNKIPAIGLIVEENALGRFIEVVTGPTSDNEILTTEYHKVLKVLFEVLAGKRFINKPATSLGVINYKLEEIVEVYNFEIDKLVKAGKLNLAYANKYKLRVADQKGDNPDINDPTSLARLHQLDIKVKISSEVLAGKDELFQQNNVMIDIVKIFKDPDFAKEYFFSGAIHSELNDVQNLGYKSYMMARQSVKKILDENPAKLGGLSDYGVAFLIHAFYNLYSEIQSNEEYSNEDYDTGVFFRWSPEEILYSALPNEDIDKLNKWYGKDGSAAYQETFAVLKLALNGLGAREPINDILTHVNLDFEKNKTKLLPGDIYKNSSGFNLYVGGKISSEKLELKPGKTILGLKNDSRKARFGGKENINQDNLYFPEMVLQEYFIPANPTVKKFSSKKEMLLKHRIFNMLDTALEIRRNEKGPVELDYITEKKLGLSTYKKYRAIKNKTQNSGLGAKKEYYPEALFNMAKSWGQLPLHKVAGVNRPFGVAELRTHIGINSYNLPRIILSGEISENLKLKDFYKAQQKIASEGGWNWDNALYPDIFD